MFIKRYLYMMSRVYSLYQIFTVYYVSTMCFIVDLVASLELVKLIFSRLRDLLFYAMLLVDDSFYSRSPL